MSRGHKNNKVGLYEGKLLAVDPDVNEYFKYTPNEYTNYFFKKIEKWKSLKYPSHKGIGWKGFVEGKDSDVYEAAPHSRLNSQDGMPKPPAQAKYEKYFETIFINVRRTIIHFSYFNISSEVVLLKSCQLSFYFQ